MKDKQKKKQVASHQHISRSAWLRLRLFSIVLLGLSAYYWYQHYVRPQQLFKMAVKVSPRNFEEADRLLANAIVLSGGSFPEAELYRVRLLGANGHWEEAMGAFSLIQERDALDTDALVSLGDFAFRSQAIHLARNCLTSALENDPSRASAYRHLIRLELSVGNESRARKYCEALLAIDGTDATAWQILGTVAMNQGEPSLAINAFKNALSRVSTQAAELSIREDLIQVLIDNGDYQEAQEELTTLKQQGELTSRAILEEAYLLRLAGDSAQAMDLVQALIDESGNDLLPAFQLAGFLQLDLNHPEQALEFLTPVVNVQPYNKEAHFKIAEAYRRLGENQQAQDHLKKSQLLTDQAIELLKIIESLEKDPSNTALRKHAIELCDILGKTAEADRLRSIK